MKKRELIMDKNGAVDAKFVIEISILVVSFIVILFFYYLAVGNNGQVFDKEACHQSVVMRSTLNYGVVETSSIVPLKCKTERICLESGNGKCDNFGTISKDNPITMIKVSGKDDEIKTKTLEQASQALADCHAMLGEGKLDFMPEKTFSNNYCLICSRIAFDDATYEKVKDTNYYDLYQYLDAKKTGDGTSYLKYLYEYDSPEIAALAFDKTLKDAPNNKQYDTFKKIIGNNNPNFENINVFSNKDNAVIVQIYTPGAWTRYGQGLAGAVITGTVALSVFISFPITITAGTVLLAIGATTTTGYATYFGTYFITPHGNYYTSPVILPYDSETFKKLGCNDLETAP